MRLVSFFVLSLALHVAALAYPVSFADDIRSDLIPVTIIAIPQEANGTRGSGGSAIPAEKAAPKPRPVMRRTAEAEIEARIVNPPEPKVLAVTEIEKISDNGIELISAIVGQTENNAPAATNAANRVAHGDSAVSGGTGAGGNGLGGSGFGRGDGAGRGEGSAGGGIVVTQASYRDTPKPDYPEKARREGREGSVLLRVLVDDRGYSKRVEINRSSGSEALDHAAIHAIKRWRFHPAHYAGKPIESWLRIPIEFRLADASSR